MNNLADWLRQLITIIIVAGFIEMLTPDNSLKKAVKLVIGLMVMLIMLQPVTRFFKIQLDLESIFSLSQSANYEPSQQVLERGLVIRDRWQKGFNSQQRALAKEKIESVIGLIDGIDLREVRFSNPTSGPSRVTIRVVPITEEDLSKISQDKLSAKIQNSVRLVCNYSKEQIEVVWDENS